MQTILAYRKNGCLVGLCSINDWEERGASMFANLISPIKLGGPPRNIYVVNVNINDEDDYADIEDLILDIGGTKAGFQAADIASHYLPPDWSLEEAEPVAVEIVGDQPKADEPYIVDGVLTCSVCGKSDCPWMEAPEQPEPEQVEAA